MINFIATAAFLAWPASYCWREWQNVRRVEAENSVVVAAENLTKNAAR